MNSFNTNLLQAVPVSPQRGPMYASQNADSVSSTIGISSVSESVNIVAQKVRLDLKLTFRVKFNSRWGCSFFAIL